MRMLPEGNQARDIMEAGEMEPGTFGEAVKELREKYGIESRVPRAGGAEVDAGRRRNVLKKYRDGVVRPAVSEVEMQWWVDLWGEGEGMPEDGSTTLEVERALQDEDDPEVWEGFKRWVQARVLRRFDLGRFPVPPCASCVRATGRPGPAESLAHVLCGCPASRSRVKVWRSALIDNGEEVPESCDEEGVVRCFLKGDAESRGGIVERIKLARDLARKLERDRRHTPDLSYEQWAAVDREVAQAADMIREAVTTEC